MRTKFCSKRTTVDKVIVKKLKIPMDASLRLKIVGKGSASVESKRILARIYEADGYDFRGSIGIEH